MKVSREALHYIMKKHNEQQREHPPTSVLLEADMIAKRVIELCDASIEKDLEIVLK